jgi:hypothetical protein
VCATASVQSPLVNPKKFEHKKGYQINDSPVSSLAVVGAILHLREV